MSKNFQERIEELLLCNICYECLSQPKTLICGHAFCLYCLEKLLANQSRIKCPTCRSIQGNINEKEDLLALDTPLYIKQSLNVLKDHQQKPQLREELHASRGPPENNDVANDLMEFCYVSKDKDGDWQENGKINNTNTVEKNNDCIEISESESKGAESSCSDSELLMFTQEITFGKICKKIFKQKKSENKVSKAMDHCERYNGSFKNFNNNSNDKKEQSKPKYFPKYICHATAVTGLGLKPKYVPGSLKKTKAVPAMMCQGLYLKQQKDISIKKTQTSYPARKNMETDTIQGPFGYVKKSCFLPRKGPRKVVFAMKF